jgi:hypothetical protein
LLEVPLLIAVTSPSATRSKPYRDAGDRTPAGVECLGREPQRIANDDGAA